VPHLSNTTITYLVAGGAGVIGFTAYASLILVPAWTAYSRLWERVAAMFLSLYVLAAMVGTGVLAGIAIVYYWDRL
jgi:hypothetical protein